MTRRIVACGGQQLYQPALTRYVLELTERSHPKILFLPTASGEDPAYLLTFYQQLAGGACPHYDSEERRRPVYAREIAAGLPAGIALEDAVAARFDDERLVEVVSARPDGRAFRVDSAGEHPLAVRVLS